MDYKKLNLKNGEKWTQEHIAHLEDGIFNVTKEVSTK